MEESEYRQIMKYSDSIAQESFEKAKMYKGETMRVGSKEYEGFIRELGEKMESKSGKHYICLFCWKFLDIH